MKKCILTLCTLLLLQVYLSAQFGAQDKEARNLYLLARTWGLLKYHHPDVKNCEHDWDKVLLNTLENLDGASQSEFRNLIEDMIDEAGPLSGYSDANLSFDKDELLYNIENRWYNTRALSLSVRTKIDRVHKKARESANCYLSTGGAGVADFSNEMEYDVGEYPDKYIRTLAVFRYWNIIDMFFPYKHLMDRNWNYTFLQYALPIIYAKDKTEYHLAFKQMIVQINDSHSFFISNTFNEWSGRYARPYAVRFIEGETVITRAIETNLISNIPKFEAGDIIRSINGKSIEEIRDAYRPYALGSNDPVIERDISRYMIYTTMVQEIVEVEKKDGSIATVSSKNDNQANISLHQSSNDNPSYKIIDTECGEYGYVDMGQLQPVQIPEMVNNLWSKEAIIFDIRNYPNGTLWPLHNYLYDTSMPQASFTVPNLQYPGTFFWIDVRLGSGNTRPTYQGKILILFDERTQSQAEYTVMGMEQHPGALKIGSQTSGADGNVTLLTLPGGITTYYTGLGTYYPDRRPTQRIGIVPDIEVRPTIAGIREGRDEVLEMALDCSLLDGGNNLPNQGDDVVVAKYGVDNNSTAFYDDILPIKDATPTYKDKIEYSLYPNPVVGDDILFISTQDEEANSIYYTLHNEVGRTVKTGQLSIDGVNHYYLPIEGLSTGLYTLSLRNGTSLSSQKFVVTK